MLCAEGDTDSLENPNFLAQEKFDGHRAIMYVDQQGSVHFYSRRTSKVTGEKEDNTDRLKNMCAFPFSDFKDSIFDGELVMQGGNTNSSKVQQLLGSTPERAEELWEQGTRLQYKIFDVIKFQGLDLEKEPLLTRISFLMLLYKSIPSLTSLSPFLSKSSICPLKYSLCRSPFVIFTETSSQLLFARGYAHIPDCSGNTAVGTAAAICAVFSNSS